MPTSKTKAKEVDPLLEHGYVGKPLFNKIVVSPAPAEERSAGGIIIPDTAQEKPVRGLVVAVGNGLKDQAMELKPGDHILYGKYAGTEVQLRGRAYLIMSQLDVLIVV